LQDFSVRGTFEVQIAKQAGQAMVQVPAEYSLTDSDRESFKVRCWHVPLPAVPAASCLAAE
jgi:hypothetical protein